MLLFVIIDSKIAERDYFTCPTPGRTMCNSLVLGFVLLQILPQKSEHFQYTYYIEHFQYNNKYRLMASLTY